MLPKSSPNDRVFMMKITRCILDAGWEGKPYSIKNHMLEFNRNIIKCKDTGKAPSYPSLGLHPVKDLLGMGPAADMLMCSL